MQIVSRIGALGVLISVISALPGYAQTTTRVSVSTAGAQGPGESYNPAISADGRYLVFVSDSNNLVPDDTNNATDVFLYDRQTGTTERINLGPGGAQAQGGGGSCHCISADGRFVVFGSADPNLVSGDTNNIGDLFVRDRQTATTTRVNVATGGGEANGPSSTFSGFGPVISADGRYVAFMSSATNLVANDTNAVDDVFLHDRQAGTTVRVSVAAGGAQANNVSYPSSMSSDGRYVVFISNATNLVAADTLPDDDVYVRDLQAGTTTLVSATAGGVKGNNFSREASISADGRFVAFLSMATNLGDDGGGDIFIHDRQSGITSSLNQFPSPVGQPLPDSPLLPEISGNGRFVCYTRLAITPVFFQSVVLFDRETQTKTIVDVTTSGTPSQHGHQLAPLCAVNADGTVVAFSSEAPNLVPGDTNNKSDIFARALPILSTDKSTLSFTAVTSGGTFVSQTGAQSVRLTQHRDAAITWTVTPSQPWLQVTPGSGAGSGTLTVSVAPVAGLPSSGTVTATIAFAIGGGVTTVPPITVSLTLAPSGTTLAPFGTVDTPTDNRVGVTGAVPFTGWALDDIEITRVSICRAAFGAEVAPIDPNCGGAAEIFVGFAVFIDGARPDVAAAYASYPQATRAGWGFMVLTNMLPAQGNGTYRFTMRAQDREGNWFVLGNRTMTCANASATLPFGTLDTPLQGGTASGAMYVNFGWTLTPKPKTIPLNGSTIQVLVDGVSVGTADYNHARPDIQALFPGFNNTNGAVGFKILDTTALSNGLHTISWVVTDDQAATEGIGSRFFAVSNGVGAVTAAATSASSKVVDVDAAPVDTTPLVGRRGWNLDAPYGSFAVGANGVTVVRSEEVNRVELQLGDGDYTGYLRTHAGLAPLPIGSRLDPTTNTFTWAPAVGFVGRYDVVFARSVSGRVISRRDVRIILHPKGRGSVGPQVVIDAPRANAVVNAPFMVGGWAVDLDATEDTGVSTLHAWAFPASGGAPIFLGATAYGGARPDVAAVHGHQFKDSGFSLIIQALPAGDYDLALFAWSTETMGFVAPKRVPVRVIP
jgi:Tol biopolymer transport system component